MAINYDELTKEGLSTMSDEDLQEYLGLAVNNLVDADGKHLVFQNHDEAVIYAAQLQRNHPEIRFFKIIPCYSNVVGQFFCVEPNVTEYSRNNFNSDEDYQGNTDFVLVNEIILMAIVESATREKARQEQLEKELQARMEENKEE